MDILKQIHNLQLPPLLPLPLWPTPIALVTFILFLWSFGPALKTEVRFAFLVWLRLTWAALLIPAVTGVILAVGGLRVPSATDVGGGLSKYGFRVDPQRDLEHLMYVAFALVSLYVIEMLIKGRLVEHRVGLKFLPVVTLFLYGCAYMIGRVATFPGNGV
ncbi:hypothetical protein D3875_10930 [Deinococcus cavernae]|uniref:DUF2231 domain-containing protein n=1 Tax=Deinococcus cavernae TaxID=2320857 RepID=A0A418V7E8_9DEIO|nr:hypothetical protein [Deinococcus cavernae]RJF71996.1 hypothetical protein D3875_10930 [Deinococcus cavernae]